MTDRLVSVGDDYRFPPPVRAAFQSDVQDTLTAALADVPEVAAAAAAAAVTVAADAVTAANLSSGPLTAGALASTLAPTLRPGPLSAPRGAAPIMAAHAAASGHGWTNTGSTGTVVLDDTSSYLLGSESIKLTTAGTGVASCHVTKSGLTLNLSGRQPVLWVMCDDVTKLKAIEVRLGDATFASFFYFEFESAVAASQNDRYLRSGKWTALRLPWGAKGPDTGTPNRASLAQVRVTALDYGGGNPATVHVNGFGYQPEPAAFPTGVCSITVDDGWADQWNIFRPALDRYGYVATALPIVDLLGTPSYMTLANLNALQNDYGWEIGGHAFTAANHNHIGGFTGLGDAVLDTELRSLKAWLLDHGFRGRDYLAYPQGFIDDTVLEVTARYFAAGRTQNQFRRETLPVTDRLRTRTVNLGNNISLATAQSYLATAAANKEWINFTAHRLGATASDGSTWVAADFTALLASIASSGLAVRTYGEALRSAA